MAKRRMLTHHLPLVVGQRAGLAQDRVWHRDLADVVEQRAVLQYLEAPWGRDPRIRSPRIRL